MVKIMSLMQNMWERPLVRELRKVQNRISDLEYQTRELWPKDTDWGDDKSRQKQVYAWLGLLSECHTKRFELMKRIGEGRRHDE